MGPGQPGGFGDDGFRKKQKFDEPLGGGGDELESPPATLRVLIRNTDAGGIIGKVF